jgi:hypothetical protein
MYDSTTTGGRKKQWLGAAGLLAAGVIGGVGSSKARSRRQR